MKKAMNNSAKGFKYIVVALVVCELLFVYFYFIKLECLWDKNPQHFTYTESETYGGIAITGYTGNSSKVLIPSEIDGQAVVEISDFAFDGNNVIGEVRVPDGIKRVGVAAFKRCLNLRSVEMADSVEIVDPFAFYQSGLRSVKLSANLQEISVGSFTETKLMRVDIPSSVKCIRIGAFSQDPLLVHVVLPDSIERIERWAFFGDGIEEIVLPEKLTELGSWAFSENRSLTSVKIESKNLKCGYGVFDSTHLRTMPECKYEVEWGEDCFTRTHIPYEELTAAGVN